MPKLMKRTVEAAEIRASECFVWDDEVPGFGLCVLPTGPKGFVVTDVNGRPDARVPDGLVGTTAEEWIADAVGLLRR
jgi:hypothetical protein